MILTSKTRKFMMALFGRGTLSVTAEPKQPKPDGTGVVVVIAQCKPSKVGSPVPKSNKLKRGPCINLYFNSIESIDVLIRNLEWARKIIEEEQNGEKV